MTERVAAVAALQTALQYKFKNPTLLEQALTHASVGSGAKRVLDNERLEFLGDRVLGLMIADRLVSKSPSQSEGILSQRFHALVSREACAQVARQLGVGPALRLAPGETRSGGRENDTILGDACEALIAAVYLDGGFAAAVSTFAPLWEPQIVGLADRRTLNPKSALQEWAAARKYASPVYTVVSRSGPDHAPTFCVEVAVEGLPPEQAEGKSRQDAEKAAASALLLREDHA